MYDDREYQICVAISKYLRLFYPKVLFHFDYAGMHHTKAQAGRMKAIQGGRGWPDLFIAEAKHYVNVHYSGLFIEIKAEGTRLTNRNLEAATPHIAEQFEFMEVLKLKGYKADFGVGFDECKKLIDQYLIS